METRKQLREELEEVYKKESELFSTVYDIEKIVEKGEAEHEMAILTLDKIKKRIRQRYQH